MDSWELPRGISKEWVEHWPGPLAKNVRLKSFHLCRFGAQLCTQVFGDKTAQVKNQ